MPAGTAVRKKTCDTACITITVVDKAAIFGVPPKNKQQLWAVPNSKRKNNYSKNAFSDQD